MKKFIALYYATPEVMAKNATLSTEEKTAGLTKWYTWKEKNNDHIVSFGAPLVGGQKVENETIKPSQSNVSGFSILQGESLSQIQEICTDHPHLAWAEGTSIEIHEFISM